MPALGVAEVAGTVSRTHRDPIAGRLAADFLQGRSHVTFIAIDEALAREAAEIAADDALRGADATYTAVARRHGCTLVSLDREQRERSALVIPTCTPAEALAALDPPPESLP